MSPDARAHASAAKASPLHHKLLTGWGGTAPTAADVAAPITDSEVARLLGSSAERGVVARGLGRSYGDAGQNAGGVVADMTGLDAIRSVDLDAGLITVDAGMSLERLMATMIPRGWFPPVLPGTRHVTVGGAIAADIHGKNHHFEGSFANHVRSFVLETPHGRHNVTPANHADVFWATAGGMGLTGIITEATLDLLAIESAYVLTDTERVADLDGIMETMSASDDRYRYSVAWIDSLATGKDLGRGVLMRGDHAPADALSRDTAREPLAYEPSLRVETPPWMPSGLVNKWTVRAFNELWYRKAPAEQRAKLASIESFFHPLDAVRNWNRVYGTRGFLQYQFVVPFGAEDTVRVAVERLASARAASPVTVFKRFGAGNPGGLSFPMPGWTLTLDIPTAVPGLGQLLDGLDELVASAGGRIYLAKDSRAKPETVEAMYSGLSQWREIQAKLDPEGVMQSDLSRRLRLTKQNRQKEL